MARFFLPVLLLVFAFAAMDAQAQFAPSAQAIPSLQFGQKNPQLKTLLELQNQLQLLHRLIDHEQAVNQMVQAAVDVGISDPIVPAPDKEICREVPANIPCAQSYSALYDNYSVEKKPAFVPPPVVTAKATPAKKEKIAPPPEIASAPVYWTNITCMAGKCSAVISDNPNDPKASYRISPGEKLSDGSVISTISAAGVSILRNNKVIQLDPAPRAG